MSLCTVCKEIPWRTPRRGKLEEQEHLHAFARLSSIAGDRFLWRDGSGRPVKPGREYWPFIRNQFDGCLFCLMVTEAVRDPAFQPTYHGGFKLKRKNFYGEAWNDKAIWTQLIGRNDDRPIVRLWVGDSGPEHFVRTIEPQTIFDSFLSKEWPFVVHQNPFHLDVRRQMISWLKCCNTEHSACSQHNRGDSLLPTRFLDLEALPSSKEITGQDHGWHRLFHGKQIRLRESKAGQQGRYVALSYCWGSSLPCKTTLENLETHTLGLSFDNLPNTLQDSIIVTRLLGLRFIWIDCLCIIQNDKDDWERESARMASIYSNSYLAIAATRATNCNQGILELRNRPVTKSIEFEDNDGPFELYFTERPRGIGVAEEFIHGKEPLQRRAWVFQERILAPRTLHFGSDQMFWECANGIMSEDGWGSFDPRDSSFEHSLPHIAEELVSGTYRRLSATKWATLVSSYTALNITYGSDRLPALAGIITKLQDLTRDVCYAGLWKRHFLSGLLWYVDNPKKPAEYRAPSWSFAALDGNISYFVDLRWVNEETHYVATLEECSVTPLRKSVLGELKSGYAKITGPMTTIEAYPKDQYPSRMEYWNCMIQMGNGSLREAMARFDFGETIPAEVVMITVNVGLLIQSTDASRAEWIRVGILEVFVDDQQETEFQGFYPILSAKDYPPSQTITIV